MSKITRFEDMQLWKDAVDIGVDVYRLTSRGKLKRDFAAIDQLRRAAISISNNIVEGFEYNGNRFFIRFSSLFERIGRRIEKQPVRVKASGSVTA
jgi:hypothetical protein